MRLRLVAWFCNKYKVTPWQIRAAFFDAAKSLVGGIGIGIGIAIAFGAQGLLASFQERASLPMIEARFEVVREAMKHIPCDGRILAFAPWIAEAKDLNVRRGHEVRANSIWYADPFSPDGWKLIEPIQLPCETQEARH